MCLKKMDPKNRRNSILKKNSEVETTVDFTNKLKRRISFSGRKSVRVFSGEEETKAWNNSYEESDNAVNASGEIEQRSNIILSASKLQSSEQRSCLSQSELLVQANKENVCVIKKITNIGKGDLLHDYSPGESNLSGRKSKSIDSTLCTTKEYINISNAVENFVIENSIDVTLFDSERPYIEKGKVNSSKFLNFQQHQTKERIREPELNAHREIIHKYGRMDTCSGKKEGNYEYNIPAQTADNITMDIEREAATETKTNLIISSNKTCLPNEDISISLNICDKKDSSVVGGVCDMDISLPNSERDKDTNLKVLLENQPQSTRKKNLFEENKNEVSMEITMQTTSSRDLNENCITYDSENVLPKNVNAFGCSQLELDTCSELSAPPKPQGENNNVSNSHEIIRPNLKPKSNLFPIRFTARNDTAKDCESKRGVENLLHRNREENNFCDIGDQGKQLLFDSKKIEEIECFYDNSEHLNFRRLNDEIELGKVQVFPKYSEETLAKENFCNKKSSNTRDVGEIEATLKGDKSEKLSKTQLFTNTSIIQSQEMNLKVKDSHTKSMEIEPASKIEIGVSKSFNLTMCNDGYSDIELDETRYSEKVQLPSNRQTLYFTEEINIDEMTANRNEQKGLELCEKSMIIEGNDSLGLVTKDCSIAKNDRSKKIHATLYCDQDMNISFDDSIQIDEAETNARADRRSQKEISKESTSDLLSDSEIRTEVFDKRTENIEDCLTKIDSTSNYNHESELDAEGGSKQNISNECTTNKIEPKHIRHTLYYNKDIDLDNSMNLCRRIKDDAGSEEELLNISDMKIVAGDEEDENDTKQKRKTINVEKDMDLDHSLCESPKKKYTPNKCENISDSIDEEEDFSSPKPEVGETHRRKTIIYSHNNEIEEECSPVTKIPCSAERDYKWFGGTPHRSVIEFEEIEKRTRIEPDHVAESIIYNETASKINFDLDMKPIESINETEQIYSAIDRTQGHSNVISLITPLEKTAKRSALNMTPVFPLAKKRLTKIFDNCNLEETVPSKNINENSNSKKDNFEASLIDIDTTFLGLNMDDDIIDDIPINPSEDEHKKGNELGSDSPLCTPIITESFEKKCLIQDQYSPPEKAEDSNANQLYETIPLPRCAVMCSYLNQRVADISDYYNLRDRSFETTVGNENTGEKPNPEELNDDANISKINNLRKKYVDLMRDSRTSLEGKGKSHLNLFENILNEGDVSELVNVKIEPVELEEFERLNDSVEVIVDKDENIADDFMQLSLKPVESEEFNKHLHNPNEVIILEDEKTTTDSVAVKMGPVQSHVSKNVDFEISEPADPTELETEAIQIDGHDSSIVCRKCKRCQQTLLNETESTTPMTADSFVLPEIPSVPLMDRLRQVRSKPTITAVNEYWRLRSPDPACGLGETDGNLTLSDEYKSVLDNLICEYRNKIKLTEQEMAEAQSRKQRILEKPYAQRLDDLLRSNLPNWIFDYQTKAGRTFVLTHRRIVTFSLAISYSENDAFGLNITIKGIKLCPNNFRREHWKPFHHVLDFELRLELPYDLSTFCEGSDVDSVFGMLKEIDRICVNVEQFCRCFWKLLCTERSSLVKEGNSVHIRKIDRRVLDQGKYRSVEETVFRIEVKNIRKICFKDIATPSLHLFREDIEFLPIGLDFLRIFLKDPMVHMKNTEN